jgi:hypothetical protein
LKIETLDWIALFIEEIAKALFLMERRYPLTCSVFISRVFTPQFSNSFAELQNAAKE